MRTTILCNTMNTCRDTGFLEHSSCSFGHVLEDSSNLPLLELEGRFRKQAQYRHKCRMAAIEVEANAKIWKSLIGRSRPMRGGYVPGDAENHFESRSRSPSVANTLDGTPKGHRCLWRSHRATAIKCVQEPSSDGITC